MNIWIFGIATIIIMSSLFGLLLWMINRDITEKDLKFASFINEYPERKLANEIFNKMQLKNTTQRDRYFFIIGYTKQYNHLAENIQKDSHNSQGKYNNT